VFGVERSLPSQQEGKAVSCFGEEETWRFTLKGHSKFSRGRREKRFPWKKAIGSLIPGSSPKGGPLFGLGGGESGISSVSWTFLERKEGGGGHRGDLLTTGLGKERGFHPRQGKGGFFHSRKKGGRDERRKNLACCLGQEGRFQHHHGKETGKILERSSRKDRGCLSEGKVRLLSPGMRGGRLSAGFVPGTSLTTKKVGRRRGGEERNTGTSH